MTEPAADAPNTHEGGDVVVEPADLDLDVPTPATSDPAEMTEDEALGGVGGGSPGGAG